MSKLAYAASVAGIIEGALIGIFMGLTFPVGIALASYVDFFIAGLFI